MSVTVKCNPCYGATCDVVSCFFYWERENEMTRICKATWGMGTSFDETGEYASYGYPIYPNPSQFMPDPEVCSEREIAQHAADCTDWEDSEELRRQGGKL